MSDSILNTLREEHRQIDDLLSQIEACSEVVTKKELYLRLKDILIPHMEAEEQTIYAHLIDDVHDEEAEEVAFQAEEEHSEMKDLLGQLDNIGIENEDWNRYFHSLKDLIRQHVEAEESALFAEAKEDFSKEELLEFGDEYEDAKQHVQPY